MTYSNIKSSVMMGSMSLLLVFGVISCSESNSPQLKNSNNSTFYVDAVTASFTTVGEANAQGVHNKKLLSLEACLKDNAQTNSVNNLNFKLTAGEVSAAKSTDHRGCILWQELVEYDPQESEKNVFMTRTVEALQSHSGAEKVVFSVNPWKDQFAFNRQASVAGNGVNVGPVSYKAKDLSQAAGVNYDYDVYVKISESGANGVLSPIKRQTEINTLRLKYKGIDYENLKIDQKLNLTFPFTYITDLSISFLRQNLGQISEEKIKMGNFMFHLVFLKEQQVVQNPKPEDVIAAVSFKGKPRGDAGMISVPITVNFNNVAALSSRMSAILTVTSLDQPALFTEQTYEGMVNGIMANEQLEIGLIPNDSNAHDLFEKYVSSQETKAVDTLTAESVLTSEGFKLVNKPLVTYTKKGFFSSSTETVDLAKTIQDLQDQHEFTKVELRALCSAFFQGSIKTENNSPYQSCLNSPAKVLSAEVREFVNSVNPKPVGTPSFGRGEVLEITSSFVLAEGSASTSGYGLEGSIGGNVEVGASTGLGWKNESDDPNASKPLLPVSANASAGVKLGLGGKAYATKGYEKSQKDGKSVSISSTEALSSQPISVTMSVVSQKCLLMSSKSGWTARMKAEGIPTARYFCTAKNEGQKTENYFLLNHSKGTKASSIADVYSPVVNPLRLMVRGDQSYTFLKTLLTDKYGYKILVGMTADKVVDDPSNFMTQEAPLMLSSSRRIILAK